MNQRAKNPNVNNFLPWGFGARDRLSAKYPRLDQMNRPEFSLESEHGARKDFLGLVLLIGYDGMNMSFVFFKNEIISLMNKCLLKEDI